MQLTLPNGRVPSFCRGFHAALLAEFPGATTGEAKGLPTLRDENGNKQGVGQCMVVDYGGKRILIHTWDYTSRLNLIPHGEIDLCMCVQYSDDLERLKNIKVVPFTMFASDQPNFYAKLDSLQAIVNAQTPQYELGFSGRTWACRKPWFKISAGFDWFYWEPTPKQATGCGTVEEYAAKLGEWRRCLVLYGKGSRTNASHNRRENECAALGIPMAINYKPHYYVPFEPGVHYTYVPRPMQIQAFGEGDAGMGTAAAARDYWERYMSAPGVASLFRRICEEQL